MSSTSEVTSTWKVASAIPGRIRLRHDAIRDRRVPIGSRRSSRRPTA